MPTSTRPSNSTPRTPPLTWNSRSCAHSSRSFPRPRRFSNRPSSSNPNSSRALRVLASTLVYEKQPAKAISRVQEQIAKSPQNADMYDLLADLQIGHRRPAGVRLPPRRRQCSSTQPIAPPSLPTLAREVTAGDPAKAVAKWQQWTKDHPTDVRAFTLLGSLQESQGDRTGAMDSYKKALAIQPEHACRGQQPGLSDGRDRPES